MSFFQWIIFKIGYQKPQLTQSNQRAENQINLEGQEFNYDDASGSYSVSLQMITVHLADSFRPLTSPTTEEAKCGKEFQVANLLANKLHLTRRSICTNSFRQMNVFNLEMGLGHWIPWRNRSFDILIAVIWQIDKCYASPA